MILAAMLQIINLKYIYIHTVYIYILYIYKLYLLLSFFQHNSHQRTLIAPNISFHLYFFSGKAKQVRFMVDGERIAADDTAEKLGLEDLVGEWGPTEKGEMF